MKRHPLSNLFARFDLKIADLSALAEDIQENGLISPITTHDEMILDGWNRFQACRMAGVEPTYAPLRAGLDPWSFVMGANFHRRHMTPAERVGVMLLKAQMDGSAIPESEQRSKLTTPEVINNDHPPSVREIAKSLDVSYGTAQKAQQLLKNNEPGIAEALAGKKISLDEALGKPKSAPVEPSPDVDALQARIAELESENEDLKEQNQELARMMKDTTEENESLRRILDSEDLLGSYQKEVRANQELARVTQSRNNGLMVENADLGGRLKSALRRLERFEKKEKTALQGVAS